METGVKVLWSTHAADVIQWFELRRDEMKDTPFALNAWTFVSLPPASLEPWSGILPAASRVSGRPH